MPEVVGSVKGNKLSSYSVALEAWRRGLKVVLHDRRLRRYTVYAKRERWRYGFTFDLASKNLPKFLLKPNKKMYTFHNSQILDRFTKSAKTACDNKDIAKHWLLKADVPIPSGKRFNSEIAHEEVVRYVLNKIGFPVVIKPAAGHLGKGVFVNIKDKETLEELLVHVREELGYGDVIVEEHVVGEDYRVFVLGDRVLSVVKRIPANITGDGKQTVAELIKCKNHSRKTNPYLSSGLIKIDREVHDCLNAVGYSLESIAEKGKTIYLRRISNLSAGGDSLDVTDEISEGIKKLAVRAVKAVPHLHSAGVDVLVNKTQNGEAGVIIELNYMAHVGLHLFPVKGKARDIAGAIMDYHFPESARRKGRCSRLYFDPDLAVEPIARGIVSEVSLKPPPPGKILYRCFEVKGELRDPDSMRRLQLRALKLNLSGFARLQSSGNFQVVAAGKRKAQRSLRSFLSKRLHTTIVGESEWEKAVAAGFQTE